jgi:inhibitor of cysteine peptidase
MTTNPKTVTVTEKEKDTTVTLNKGDVLVVKLSIQGGTGYTWVVAKKNAAVLKPMGKPETEKPDKPKPGGSLTMVFRFTAEAKGTSDLEMEYKRPFEKDKAPLKTFKLSVKVE